MSFVLPLAILSLSVVAAPVPSLAPRSDPISGTGTPALGSGAYSWTSYEHNHGPGHPFVSSTAVTDSASVAGNDLDSLSSTLQKLASLNSNLNSNTGTWVSSDDFANYLGTGTSNLVVPANGLLVRAGEHPGSWASISEGQTDSRTVADLEAASWVLLDDLVNDLTEDTFVPAQSILICRPRGSPGTAVYVPLTNSNDIRLDHHLNTFLYTDIVGVSSALGLGNNLGTATPPAENLYSGTHLVASTQAGSETDLLALPGEFGIGASTVVDSGTSDPLASPSSSPGFDGNNLLNSSVDADIASDPDLSNPSSLGVSTCS